MSVALYTELSGTAAALIAEFGAPIPIERRTPADVDPVTGVTHPGFDQSYAPAGIVRDIPSSLIDGTTVQQGDRMLIIDASTEPRLTDRPLIDGERWSVVRIDASKPAGVAIVYRLQVRG